MSLASVTTNFSYKLEVTRNTDSKILQKRLYATTSRGRATCGSFEKRVNDRKESVSWREDGRLESGSTKGRVVLIFLRNAIHSGVFLPCAILPRVKKRLCRRVLITFVITYVYVEAKSGVCLFHALSTGQTIKN